MNKKLPNYEQDALELLNRIKTRATSDELRDRQMAYFEAVRLAPRASALWQQDRIPWARLIARQASKLRDALYHIPASDNYRWCIVGGNPAVMYSAILGTRVNCCPFCNPMLYARMVKYGYIKPQGGK